jgi:hypothetical protein
MKFFRNVGNGLPQSLLSTWFYIYLQIKIMVNLKRRLHGVISQKMILFITTAVKTSSYKGKLVLEFHQVHAM